MFGPVIEGEKVTLRPPRTEDCGVYIEWFSDMEVTRYLARRWPVTLEREHEWLKSHEDSDHSVVWSLEYEGKLVGFSSVENINWNYLFGITGTIIGDRSVWGRGIASEMMILRRDFAFSQLPIRKLQSGYLEGNTGSARAQAKAGYREVGRMREEYFRDGQWLDHILTEILRSEWEALRTGTEAETGPVWHHNHHAGDHSA